MALRLEEAPTVALSGHWWHVRAIDTGVGLAIENPRMERDFDDDGSSWMAPAYDELKVLDAGEWRDATDEESDEYADDVNEYLRYSDWN